MFDSNFDKALQNGNCMLRNELFDRDKERCLDRDRSVEGLVAIELSVVDILLSSWD